ncbi:RagB/SusD family nutrient uptake outer membrane protein [Riemerella columbina]|uniref:RagB/SusD family nutrient uptake outer membrane protein n=1 Tax=Riemerella columbina TaxID=103810 RepID=UPI0026708D60|nr:RagB/SusD family nutrient uptake outer membrane protein [Riemerella columbina]WKS94671.1 RagB/SusD family nutrient uptake outer membrane protein [Riemerella columbina]
MKSRIIKPLLLIAALSAGVTSCERYLDITPTGRVVPQTEEDFRALLTRAYQQYPQHKALLNLKTDEVKAGNSSESLKAIYTWSEANATSESINMPYASFYEVIFNTNYIIKNLKVYNAKNAVTDQILGEALALRAYTYFQLLGIYAPAVQPQNGAELAVPLVTDINLEGSFPRATLAEVYQQIWADLNQAEGLLQQEKYEAGYNYRFTTTALHAFKARLHQHRQEWAQALAEAEKVLAVNAELEDFNQFTVLPSHYQSKESIMNLDLAVNATTSRFSRVSDEHLALFDQNNDLRFAHYFKKNGNAWQTTKYKDNDYKCSFRVADLLLIKAEAEAHLGQEAASKSTLIQLAEKRYNAIGLQAFKAKINALSGADYLQELWNERARELSFEGLRWGDLRRTTQPEITHIFDGQTYKLSAQDARYTTPFPKEARLKNPQL